jgi:hypothetical protein
MARKPGVRRSGLVYLVERFAEHAAELERAFKISDRTKYNFLGI